LTPNAGFAIRYRAGIITNRFVGEVKDMEMKMSVEKAKQRALDLMYRGYH
jgi:hypothetical protein